MREDPDLQALLHGGGQDDELWLISYADLLTLLIGFFVLLLAVSPPKTAQFERMAASLTGEATPLEELKEKVDTFITQEGLEKKVLTRQEQDGLVIEFKDALLFDSGSADLRAEGAQAITPIARMLQTLPRRGLVIEGYTDDVPIRTSRFASNWELSSQRAINVRAALEQSGVGRERMSVRGFADTRRVDVQGPPEEQRAANRRVVIRVE
ncbi:OmpA family protein [[Archangium] primigenium]|uniref:OmpA family protein n=1 Tax=Melittangium TaxID=44 RepID=UPI001959E7AA|nr:flagellar motor protein MotB [Archangium primigenium]